MTGVPEFAMPGIRPESPLPPLLRVVFNFPPFLRGNRGRIPTSAGQTPDLFRSPISVLKDGIYYRAGEFASLSEELPPVNDGRSQRERMLAGDLYIADDPELAADSLRAARLQQEFNTSDPGDPRARRHLLQQLLGSFGEGAEIRPPFYCDYGYQIRIGARTFINYGAVMLDVAAIQIGKDVMMGPNVQILTPTHPLDPELRRLKYEAAEPITIGNNVWLGGGVIVLPGVTIGENSVVGAGAIVTKDLPANVVAVGNPARVIRHL